MEKCKMKMLKIILKTTRRQELIDITDDLNKMVKEHNVVEGVCFLINPHTTGGLTLNSRMESTTALDLIEEVDRLIPTRVDFKHVFDTPADASGHIIASIVGNDLTLIISNSIIQLGKSQGVFFWEFDGPRERRGYVKMIEN